MEQGREGNRVLRAMVKLEALPYGLDAEAAQYLVDNRVAALWERYTRDGSVDLEVLDMEQTILTAKLEAIEPYLRAGTMIYTHYVNGMIWPIRRYLEAIGYTVGIYTGEDKSGLEPFLAGRVDVLVGSKPVGTGLDGLQRVSNNLIILSPPGLLQKTRRSGVGSGARAAPSAVSRSSSQKWSSATKVRTGVGTGAGGIRSASSGRSLTVRSKGASLRPLGSPRPSSSGSPRRPLRSGSSGWGRGSSSCGAP